MYHLFQLTPRHKLYLFGKTLFLLLLVQGLFLTQSTPGITKTKIYIYAAASTRNAVDELIKQFPKQDNVQVSAVYGATSALARQIIDGAPATLFLSANKAWMQEVIDAALITKHKNAFSNRLVIISSKKYDTGVNITSATDITKYIKMDRIAVAEISAVPAGIYSKQAMKNLKIWDQLKNKLAQSANVRAALALVERGETPLGIVYQTDAKASPYVKLKWRIPNNVHTKIQYPLGIHKNVQDVDAANKLYNFFTSPQGSEIFSNFGFEPD